MSKDLEADFAINELFFSKTDSRGIIQTGNSVFQRVSEYSWDELRNKPHNVIRHPDIPKAGANAGKMKISYLRGRSTSVVRVLTEAQCTFN